MSSTVWIPIPPLPSSRVCYWPGRQMGWELNVYLSWQGGSPHCAHCSSLLFCWHYGCQLPGRAASLRRSWGETLNSPPSLLHDYLHVGADSGPAPSTTPQPLQQGTLHSHLLLGSHHLLPALWRWSTNERMKPGHLLQGSLDSQKTKGLLHAKWWENRLSCGTSSLRILPSYFLFLQALITSSTLSLQWLVKVQKTKRGKSFSYIPGNLPKLSHLS